MSVWDTSRHHLHGAGTQHGTSGSVTGEGFAVQLPRQLLLLKTFFRR